MLRILHLADIHFDTRFLSRSPELRDQLKEAQHTAFRSAIDCALEEQVHCVLLGGDLFDSDRLSFSSERFLLEQLGRLSEAQIGCVYATGNHDPGGEGSRPLQIPWPSGFHLLSKAEPESIVIQDKIGNTIAHVVGAGHPTSHVDENLAALFPGNRKGVPNIGLLHTFITSAHSAEQHDRYAPCAVRDLQRTDYAYWALGHVHVCQKVDASVEAWYPGILQGRNFRESGMKGGLLVTVPDTGKPDVEFRPFATTCWETLQLTNLSNVHSLSEVRRKAQRSFELLRSNGGASIKDWFLRVELNGECPLTAMIQDDAELQELEEDLAFALDASFVELGIRNLVSPAPVDLYRNEVSIVGEVLKLLESAHKNEALLSELRPHFLARTSLQDEEISEYLAELIENLDSEVVKRFISQKP